MKRLVTWAKVSALGLGGFGLFLVAFIDASFLTLPEANDVLIVVLAARNPGRLAFYASVQTAGTVLGSLVLFLLARKGGEAILRKRFSPERMEMGVRLVRRFGVAAIAVPALLPPPTPFKLFVLLAGSLGMGTWPFVAAVAVGRFTRYFGEGLLAVWYGEEALDYIRANGEQVGLVVGLLTLAGVGAWAGWRWHRRRSAL